MNSELHSHTVKNALFTWRKESLNDKDYLVVKGVPLVEGVLNSRYVSAQEFGAFVKDWDGVPVVMRHPKENGGSARVPNADVPVIGRFFNAQMDGTRLVGEFWLEENALNGEDGETVLTRIKAQLPIEISTGYYAESVPMAGRWNDKDYSLVDRNLHPDHIALLPDEVGACSLDNGCGLNRNQLRINADGSLDQKVQHIRDGFYSKFDTHRLTEQPSVGSSYLYVRDVYETYVICEEGNDLYRVNYSASEDGAIFDERDKWQPVKIEYTPKMNVTGLTGEAADMWEEIYQEAKEQYGGDEERAAKVAWAAIKDKYKKDEKGDWVLKNVSCGCPLDGIDAQELEGLAALAVLANSA